MFYDELGPEAVIQVSDESVGMRGILVVDNSVLGPCGGGTRMALDVSVEEVAELARGMTYKFAIFGLPRGGSKAGIIGDPTMAPERKKAVLQAFGRTLRTYLQNNDVAVGPDMGVTVDDVSQIYAGAGVKNERSGLFTQLVEGDPAGFHFTGRGVVCAARSVYEAVHGSFKGATVAIEGFGQVGAGCARYVHQYGGKVVAITTLLGGVYDADGIDVPTMIELRRKHGDECVNVYKGGKPLERQELYFVDADIMVPGARPHVVDAFTARKVRAKLVCPAANIAVTWAGEAVLQHRGITCIPDFVANGGSALASWVDFLDGTHEQAFGVIDRLISSTAKGLVEETKEGQTLSSVARQRVRENILKTPRQRKSFDEIRAQIKALYEM